MGTYGISDLAGATGMSERAIRFYVQKKLLPPATHHGRGRNYTEEHMVRIRAIRRFRAERLSVKEMRVRFARLSAEELTAFGAAPPAQLAPSEVSGEGTPPGNSSAAAPPHSTAAVQPTLAVHSTAAVQFTSAGPSGAESWQRVTLLPGLEIHIRADAAPFVLRTAAEIRERYSTAPVSPSP